MAPSLTDEFVRHLFDMSATAMPDAVRHKAKRCLLDYLGVTLAGSQLLREKGNRLLDLVRGPNGCVTAIGYGRTTALQDAILINGLSAHVAELDDGERFGMLHPGAPVLSALLPLAEQERISGHQLLLGIVLGYEAAIRLTRVIQPRLKDRGYHATGTGGTMGAAIGLAAALSFSFSQMKDALSAAATAASGMLRVIRDSSELKPYNVSQAALSGWYSALIARSGFSGPHDVLAGKHGYLEMMGGEYDRKHLLGDFERAYAIEGVYVKPYAACRHCHPAIEAVLTLRARHGIQPEAIRRVNVVTYRWAVDLHDHTVIHGVASAKMSTPCGVAVALCTGKAGIAQFTPEVIQDATVASLTQRVNVRADDQLSNLVPHCRPAIVEIETVAGQVFSERVDLPKGEPENPVSDDELEEKFVALARHGGKSPLQAQDIARIVWNVEDQFDMLVPLL